MTRFPKAAVQSLQALRRTRKQRWRNTVTKLLLGQIGDKTCDMGSDVYHKIPDSQLEIAYFKLAVGTLRGC
jgi:hypothetical protein